MSLFFIVVAIALGYVVVHLSRVLQEKKTGCERVVQAAICTNKIEQAKAIKHSKSSCSVKK